MWVFAINSCGWSSITEAGVAAAFPTPTPTLAAPYGPALSCEYPKGPILYYWNYPTTAPNPPAFGIARTSGRAVGVTPLPAPVWNYLHYLRSGDGRQLADVDNIQPGLRYDYNVRACADANCNVEGPYANQVYTSCTVKARCDNMLPDLAPSPSCWQEGGGIECWKGAGIGGAARAIMHGVVR